ncbi:hypothetical protein H920_13618 [Fukomys damarensis]|uniref:Uncharacterized protein n=1 Tax=Fukomys damarensis TaxID=885580 RepID=A0A091DQ64_FUKDA|nr:hypothetical protein H920_13618 [Fukomys damarensis]
MKPLSSVNERGGWSLKACNSTEGSQSVECHGPRHPRPSGVKRSVAQRPAHRLRRLGFRGTSRRRKSNGAEAGCALSRTPEAAGWAPLPQPTPRCRFLAMTRRKDSVGVEVRQPHGALFSKGTYFREASGRRFRRSGDLDTSLQGRAVPTSDPGTTRHVVAAHRSSSSRTPRMKETVLATVHQAAAREEKAGPLSPLPTKDGHQGLIAPWAALQEL